MNSPYSESIYLASYIFIRLELHNSQSLTTDFSLCFHCATCLSDSLSSSATYAAHSVFLSGRHALKSGSACTNQSFFFFMCQYLDSFFNLFFPKLANLFISFFDLKLFIVNEIQSIVSFSFSLLCCSSFDKATLKEVFLYKPLVGIYLYVLRIYKLQTKSSLCCSGVFLRLATSRLNSLKQL